jgi:methenyltetrahydrofolate cyclohydrolase
MSHNRDRELLDGLAPFLENLASGDPTPGGGAVAGLGGALAAALTSMVANLTIGKKKYAAVEGKFRALVEEMGAARKTLIDLGVADAEAFDAYMAARRLPKDTEEEKTARRAALKTATLGATEVPMTTLRQTAALLPSIRFAADEGNPHAVSDAGIAALHCEAALRAAAMNVAINLPGLADADRSRIEEELEGLLGPALEEARAISAEVEDRLRS